MLYVQRVVGCSYFMQLAWMKVKNVGKQTDSLMIFVCLAPWRQKIEKCDR